jgi:hypothetical protein
VGSRSVPIGTPPMPEFSRRNQNVSPNSAGVPLAAREPRRIHRRVCAPPGAVERRARPRGRRIAPAEIDRLKRKRLENFRRYDPLCCGRCRMSTRPSPVSGPGFRSDRRTRARDEGTFRYLCLRSGQADSPLEESGFEPLVPLNLRRRRTPIRPRAAQRLKADPRRTVCAVTNRSSDCLSIRHSARHPHLLIALTGIAPV